MPHVEMGVLGPGVAYVDGVPVALSASRLRGLVSVLTLWRGQTVPAERIIDVLWRGWPSPGAANTLQGYVASARRVLEPDRRPRAAPAVLLHEAGGYRLDVGPEQVDAGRFESAVLRAQEFVRSFPDPMRPTVLSDGTAAEVLQADLDAAFAWWRGDAYADLGDYAAAATERRRLESLRVDARTARVIGDLALGRTSAAATRLEELVSAHPLREQLWGLWAVTLVRGDRQAHALEVLGRLRATLNEELGIDPSPAIAQLHEDVLRQEPGLLGAVASSSRRPTGDRTLPAGPPPTSAPPTSAPAQRRQDLARPHRAPLVGRDEELAVLKEAARAAAHGHVQFCCVTGEAGIGKSRLTTELTRWVRDGALANVAIVRCVDDDGAPPLWSLTKALSQLSRQTAIELPEFPALTDAGAARGEEAVGAGRFAVCEAVLDFVRKVTRTTPLLLVVEDAHWSDPTTLRVLRHIVEHAVDVPLMLLVNRRPEEARASTSDLDLALARAGGRWLQLVGLTFEQVAALAEQLVEETVPAGEIAELHARSGGNPLYVTELLRSRGLQQHQLPASLAQLIRGRLAVLPSDTVRGLQVAAVAGRTFSPELVAGAVPTAGTSDLLAVLEPARLAGIVHERRDGTWVFDHALIRDAVLEEVRPTQLSTWHAQMAAALEPATGDARARGEVARHWRAAGPQYAARAWRATAAAADRAETVFAFPEAAQLLAEALRAQRLDLASTDLERFELLERRAGACRYSSDWNGAAVAVIEAIAVAERIDAPALAARAATSLPVGSIWHVQRYGTVSGDLVHALRRSLALVDPADGALRCRILLTIATASFYVATAYELDDLVEEALVIAGSSADAELRCLALQQAYSARWRPPTAEWRLEAASEALGLARVAGNLRFEATCGALLAISLVETGRVEKARAVMTRALDLADRHGLTTVAMTLELLRQPLLVLAGRDAEAERSLGRVRELQDLVTDSNLPVAIAAAQLFAMMWQGRAEEFAAAAASGASDPGSPLELFAVMALLRLGSNEAAEALYASMPVPEPDETYMGMIVAAASAEVALRLQVPALSQRMYDWLRPFSGGVASAGSTTVVGPVDAFVALAAAGSGRADDASRYADQALEQCRRWGMPRVATWLAGLRESYGF